MMYSNINENSVDRVNSIIIDGKEARCNIKSVEYITCENTNEVATIMIIDGEDFIVSAESLPVSDGLIVRSVSIFTDKYDYEGNPYWIAFKVTGNQSDWKAVQKTMCKSISTAPDRFTEDLSKILVSVK